MQHSSISLTVGSFARWKLYVCMWVTKLFEDKDTLAGGNTKWMTFNISCI